MQDTKRPKGYALFLLIVGVIGIVAAFALSFEKIHQLKFPEEAPSCDFSVLVQCGKNLSSWQGELFGFPNPIIGLMAWPVVLATAAGIFAGARYANWYWRAFTVFNFGAFVFVLWLFTQSVFSLGTLCPWCIVTWLATIPLFWVNLFWTMKHGVWGDKVRPIGATLLSWSAIIVLGVILTEAAVAQLVLNWIGSF